MEKQQEQQEIKDIIANREEGYGYQLKIARNEKNLTTADVARELRLDEKIISALESEDQSKLPVSAFVCGYIRNYARFLSIQPEPLVEYYKREYSSNCSDPELKITKGKDIKGHSETPGFIVPVFVVVVTAVLLFGAWHLWLYVSSEFLNKDTEAEPLAAVALEQPAGSTVVTDDPEQLSLPEPAPDSYIPADNNSEATAESETTEPRDTQSAAMNNTVAEDTENTEVSAVASPPMEENPQEADEPVAAAVSSVEPAPVSASASASETPAASSQEQGLHLNFRGDSWVVIKDARGKKLATGLKRAGQSLTLEGPAPYDLFLGNGRVVDVSINGKKYDHSRYINDKNIARFSVE